MGSEIKIDCCMWGQGERHKIQEFKETKFYKIKFEDINSQTQ